MLMASVSLPEHVPAPALVALHGAADGTRDGQLYTHLHRALRGAGFAVATFDRRGEGASTGERSRGPLPLRAWRSTQAPHARGDRRAREHQVDPHPQVLVEHPGAVVPV